MAEHVWIRKAALEDKFFVFEIINSPSTRVASFHTEFIDWDTHNLWFSRRLEKEYPFYIIYEKTRKTGYIRFDKYNNDNEVLVSIAVHPQFRNMGIAYSALTLACKKICQYKNLCEIIALVKSENNASIALFEKCGFQKTNFFFYKNMPCFEYRYGLTSAE